MCLKFDSNISVTVILSRRQSSTALLQDCSLVTLECQYWYSVHTALPENCNFVRFQCWARAWVQSCFNILVTPSNVSHNIVILVEMHPWYQQQCLDVHTVLLGCLNISTNEHFHNGQYSHNFRTKIEGDLEWAYLDFQK